MRNCSYILDADFTNCSNMIADMWRSLDTAINASAFTFELNILACLQHVIDTRNSRVRIPIDFNALQDCAVFVNRVISDATVPATILYNFKIIQVMLYQCCGYSKVKFNGRTADS